MFLLIETANRKNPPSAIEGMCLPRVILGALAIATLIGFMSLKVRSSTRRGPFPYGLVLIDAKLNQVGFCSVVR